MTLSPYKAVWLFAMFDLPVDDKAARRRYAEFRRQLIQHGFSMLQYSVYARFFPSEEAAAVSRGQLRSAVPTRGQVRFLTVTDHQFGKMEVYYGKIRHHPERPPDQIQLF